jgi:hypothetical protein
MKNVRRVPDALKDGVEFRSAAVVHHGDGLEAAVEQRFHESFQGFAGLVGRD